MCLNHSFCSFPLHKSLKMEDNLNAFQKFLEVTQPFSPFSPMASSCHFVIWSGTTEGIMQLYLTSWTFVWWGLKI